MRIKRFEAKDSRTALAMIKEEMGEDAVILATKKLPQNALPGGKLSQAMIEIVAAIDYDLDEISVPPPDSQEPMSATRSSRFTTYNQNALQRQPQAPREKTAPQAFAEQTRTAAKKNSPRQQIHSEAQDLRVRFANLVKHPGKKDKKHNPPQGKKAKQKQQDKVDPVEVSVWRDQLIDNILIKDPVPLISFGEQHIVALVGATGVGKTTTAAKLAALYSLHQGKKVCLLSMDCYRIGATEQLRTYARIMRLPCEIVLRKNELKKAIDRHADKDIIIIDTAGKSPYDERHIQELQEWFDPVPGIQPHLVLSATTKKEDILSSLKVYTPLAVSSLILSKLDETRAYASLCQQVVSSELPISYLCTGQRVPEDFYVASKDFLDRLFKKGWDAISPHFSGEAPRH